MKHNSTNVDRMGRPNPVRDENLMLGMYWGAEGKSPVTTACALSDEILQAGPGGTNVLAKAVTINPNVVKKLLQLHWNKDKAAEGAKINPDAVTLTAEYLRLFVVEAHQRAQIEAELDEDETIEPHHIERIMLGIMLDF